MSTVRVAVCSEFGQVVHLMSPNNAEPKPDIVLLIDHRATNPPCQTKVICWTRAHMNLVEDTLPIYADDPRVHLILDNVWPEYVSGTYLLTYALHGEILHQLFQAIAEANSDWECTTYDSTA